MKNEKLFNETIDKLVKAYFDGTLIHGRCSQCAVGNIAGDKYWSDYFQTFQKDIMKGPFIIIKQDGDFIQARPNRFWVDPKDDYVSTCGYTTKELMDIEWAFETAPKEGDWEFNGLMAVVDVLEKIHECDTETTTATKQRFYQSSINHVQQS